MQQQDIEFTFSRDRHGNLRVEDFDASKVQWADDRKVRREEKERQQRREAKYWHSVDR